ncbi:MAG: hypothetical protein ACWGQW_07775 [bacterium]
MSKIDASVVREGKRGLMLQIKAVNVPEFGTMKCQIDYHLDSEKMADALERAVTPYQKALDGMEVDPMNEASVAEYLDTCSKALATIMGTIKAEMMSV